MDIDKDLKKGKYITLDNGKGYCIVSDVIYDNDKYLFLINPDDVKEQYYAQLELVDDNININIIDNNEEDNKQFIDILSDKFRDDMANFLAKLVEEK